MKEVLTCKQTIDAIGPYSTAIRSGNTIYVSGQLPIDKETGEMPADVKAQARQSLLNLKFILEENNSSLDDILKTTVFVTDIKKFNEINEIYGSFFDSKYPARSLVEVSNLPKGSQIEIECIATCK